MLFYQSAGFQIMVWFGYMVLDARQSLFYGDLENYVGRPDDGFFCHTDSITQTSLLSSTGSDWLIVCLHLAVVTSTGSQCCTFHATFQAFEIVGYLVSINQELSCMRIRRHACPISIVLVSALVGVQFVTASAFGIFKKSY